MWGWGTLGLRQLFKDRLLLGNMAFCVICNVNPTLLLSARHHQRGLLPLALPLSHLSQLPLFTRDPPGIGGASWGHFVIPGNTVSSLNPVCFSFYFLPCGSAQFQLHLSIFTWTSKSIDYTFFWISLRMEFLCCFGKASCCFYDF